MEIRMAQTEDIEGILRLLTQIGELHAQGRPDIFRPNALKYTATDLTSLLQDPNLPILVAVEDACVLGYAMCQRKEVKNNPVLCDQVQLYVDDLCVAEDRRGQHIGTALYQGVVSLAKQMQVSCITLNVWAFNGKALAFYEKSGMKPQRIIMEYPLENADAE